MDLELRFTRTQYDGLKIYLHFIDEEDHNVHDDADDDNSDNDNHNANDVRKKN